jgi:hypothetical protein
LLNMTRKDSIFSLSKRIFTIVIQTIIFYTALFVETSPFYLPTPHGRRSEVPKTSYIVLTIGGFLRLLLLFSTSSRSSHEMRNEVVEELIVG